MKERGWGVTMNRKKLPVALTAVISAMAVLPSGASMWQRIRKSGGSGLCDSNESTVPIVDTERLLERITGTKQN